MARIKLELPSHFHFSIELAVRITDLNYGKHVGNDRVLAYLQEARAAYFQHLGLSELDLGGGVGSVVSDCVVVYKSELFYGDRLRVFVVAAEPNKVGFDLYYKIVVGQDEKLAIEAKTGIVCLDYTTKKVTKLPEGAAMKLGL